MIRRSILRRGRAAAALLMLSVLLTSTAEAGPLKNSVRVGDRTKMYIVRAPRAGEKRIVPERGLAFRRDTPDTGPRRSAGSRPKRPTNHEWFWVLHNPADRARASRWNEAIDSLRRRPQPIVSRRILKSIAKEFRQQITAAARRHNVSEALLLAVIAVESAGKPTAKSHAGAQGLMQLIPATASRFGVKNVFDPMQNIAGGAAYLDWLLGTFKGDVLLALAGYNAGEGAVMKHNGVPPYAETRDYVVKVMDALVGAEDLCSGGLVGPRRACAWESAGSSS